MDYSNNRCGCMQRPHLPEPLHTNTGNSCGPVNQRMTGNSDRCADNRSTGSSCGCVDQVPMQRWNQVYDMSRGLTRGTIFPELDLPFVMGRCR